MARKKRKLTRSEKATISSKKSPWRSQMRSMFIYHPAQKNDYREKGGW